MRRTLATLVAVLFVTALLAEARGEAKDVLAVVLETGEGHQDLRYQPSPPESCRSFLRNFAAAKQRGLPVTLTIKAPPQVTGRVLDAWCILPDGKIMKPDGVIVEP